MVRSRNITRITFFMSMLIIAAMALIGCGSLPQGSDIEEIIRPSPNASQPADPTTVPATVVRVIDGDTIAVEPTKTLSATNDRQDEHSVRILGIDTAEMDWDNHNHECGAQEATDVTEQLLEAGDTVTLIYDEHADHTDQYGRSLAYVETNNQDVGATLIEQGLAVAWYPSGEPTPTRAEAYSQLQTQAEADSIGAWDTCGTFGRG